MVVQFLHLATWGLAKRLGVNPFDQPMVELQKRATREFLARSR
jgi:glucose-6-phosphate isomerase